MNTATVDLNGHYKTLKVAIELFIMQGLTTMRSILCSNIQVLQQVPFIYFSVKHGIDCSEYADTQHLSLVASEFRISNEIITTVAIKI
jgi:hypothetical protein